MLTLLDRLAAEARARAVAALIARAELDGIAARAVADGVRLAAPNLRTRRLGTRRTPRDPRLGWLR